MSEFRTFTHVMADYYPINTKKDYTDVFPFSAVFEGFYYKNKFLLSSTNGLPGLDDFKKLKRLDNDICYKKCKGTKEHLIDINDL
jgi:hypothetical protein